MQIRRSEPVLMITTNDDPMLEKLTRLFDNYIKEEWRVHDEWILKYRDAIVSAKNEEEWDAFSFRLAEDEYRDSYASDFSKRMAYENYQSMTFRNFIEHTPIYIERIVRTLERDVQSVIGEYTEEEDYDECDIDLSVIEYEFLINAAEFLTEYLFHNKITFYSHWGANSFCDGSGYYFGTTMEYDLEEDYNNYNETMPELNFVQDGNEAYDFYGYPVCAQDFLLPQALGYHYGEYCKYDKEKFLEMKNHHGKKPMSEESKKKWAKQFAYDEDDKRINDLIVSRVYDMYLNQRG